MEELIIPSLLFSDYFGIPEDTVEKYGAFNISLLTDLPLFIDPFLLFNSPKEDYQNLHQSIIDYLRFLRNKSISQKIDKGLLDEWYKFSEVKQNWLGFSVEANNGRGLGKEFADSLNANLVSLFKDFGNEQVTKASHLEKLCLVKEGVGKDSISDFTTNLIKAYLLSYTENFAKSFLKKEFCDNKTINKVRFNFKTETWERGTYYLPIFQGDYIILTPKDILTKDENWINKKDLVGKFSDVAEAIPNANLRAEINNYFTNLLSDNPSKGEREKAVIDTINKFPTFIDYFIRYKEDNGDEATNASALKVKSSETLYLKQFKDLIQLLAAQTNFYKLSNNSLNEARERAGFLKHVIEDCDGYRLFYLEGKPLKREGDLQILYRLTWFASISDINREVNNGRGPADFKASQGSRDATVIELKLASNKQLEKNLTHQLEVYKKANKTDKGIHIVIAFTDEEMRKVYDIANRLNLKQGEDIFTIDARANKQSASKVGVVLRTN